MLAIEATTYLNTLMGSQVENWRNVSSVLRPTNLGLPHLPSLAPLHGRLD